MDILVSAGMKLCKDFSLTDKAEFVRQVAAGEITLPYKRSYTADHAILNKFKKLRNLLINSRINERENIKNYTLANIDLKEPDLVFEPSGNMAAGQQILLITKNTDYGDTGAISDMFQEHNRLRARFSNARESPHDFFYNNANVLADDCARTYPGGLMTPYNVREALYWQSSECSAFNPVIMLYFVNKFKAKSVLDPCSGWGDRMIAAMAAGIRYCGVDPNQDLFPGYEDIHEFFSPNSTGSRITMICSPIQTADLPGVGAHPEMFDMVFTSPPYWNLEEYSGAGRVTETSESAWLKNFLYPLINICSARLNIGGYFILNINQAPRQTYIKAMLDYMSDHHDIKYLGVISYTDTRITNPQPVWIWRRVGPAPLVDSEKIFSATF